MSETVLVAIIGASGVVSAASLGVLVPAVFSTRRHAKRASSQAAQAVDQVKNSHQTNLRDELDERDRRIHKRFNRIEQYLGIPPGPDEETIP